MFKNLFAYIREGVKNAVLGGIQDAHEEITGRLEAPEVVTIETEAEAKSNGHQTARRKSLTR